MKDERATLSYKGRLMPASQARANAEFPALAVALAQQNLSVDVNSSTDGTGVVLCTVRSNGTQVAVLYTDFEIIRTIASSLVASSSLFPSSPSTDMLDRAEALVRVQFASRGAF